MHLRQVSPLPLSRFNQLKVLSRVGLLDIPLRHLLHHKIAVNLDVLSQQAVFDAPRSHNREDADRRLCVDERVDACGGVGQGEGVGCLEGLGGCFGVTWWKGAYLANGFSVRDGVGCAGGLVAGFEGVADECGAEGFDHQVVVVEGGDDGGGGDAVEGGGDVGGGHFGGAVLVRRSKVGLWWLRCCVALCSCSSVGVMS